MVESGNWIVPTLGSDPFVEQPPLFYAMAGMSWKFLAPLLGDTGSIRFACLLCGLGTILLTARIAYLLFGAGAAALTAIILATAPGFIIASHTIRVDAGLMLFVAAAMAAAIEAYRRDKPWYLIIAGLSTAAALLSKGPIALAFIGPAIAPFTWKWLRHDSASRPATWWSAHVIAMVLAMAVAGAWMLALKLHSESAWKAWFWDNQLGRFTGASELLGHHRAGKPHYYIEVLLIALAPWSLALPLWIRDLWQNRRSKPLADAATQSLAAWSFGALFLLTLAVTKRDVYLAPALPAFAIAAAAALVSTPPAWFRWWLAFWAGILLLAAIAAALSPILMGMAPAISAKIPYATATWLISWHAEHFASMALAALAIVVFLCQRRIAAVNPVFAPAAVIAISLSALLTLCTAAVNQSKSLRPPAERFADAVPSHMHKGACAWRLTETDRGALSFHADWRIPEIHTPEELVSVLGGRHPRFHTVVSSILLERIQELREIPCRVLASGDLGDARHPRPLHCIVREGK